MSEPASNLSASERDQKTSPDSSPSASDQSDGGIQEQNDREDDPSQAEVHCTSALGQGVSWTPINRSKSRPQLWRKEYENNGQGMDYDEVADSDEDDDDDAMELDEAEGYGEPFEVEERKVDTQDSENSRTSTVPQKLQPPDELSPIPPPSPRPAKINIRFGLLRPPPGFEFRPAAPAYSLSDRICGKLVRMEKAYIAGGESLLQHDPQCGPYRCKNPSRLRICWYPVEEWKVGDTKTGIEDELEEGEVSEEEL